MLAVISAQGCQIDSGREGICCCCGLASYVHNTCVSGLNGTPAPQCMRVWHTGGVTQRDRDDRPIKLLMLWFGQPLPQYLHLWIARHSHPAIYACVIRWWHDPAWPALPGVTVMMDQSNCVCLLKSFTCRTTHFVD